MPHAACNNQTTDNKKGGMNGGIEGLIQTVNSNAYINCVAIEPLN